jgi:hypothetical protein
MWGHKRAHFQCGALMGTRGDCFLYSEIGGGDPAPLRAFAPLHGSVSWRAHALRSRQPHNGRLLDPARLRDR